VVIASAACATAAGLSADPAAPRGLYSQAARERVYAAMLARRGGRRAGRVASSTTRRRLDQRRFALRGSRGSWRRARGVRSQTSARRAAIHAAAGTRASVASSSRSAA
jgi:hypothetical protein